MNYDKMSCEELKTLCNQLYDKYHNCSGNECDHHNLIKIRAKHNVSAREYNRRKSWYQKQIKLI